MTEAAGIGGPGSGGDAPYRLGPWDEHGTAELSATGGDAEALLLAGLRGVLAAARGGGAAAAAAEEDASAAAPFRGQGADLAAVFGELAADLLAQLDANGPGMDRVRLDGLLTTDEGGYTAWGYLVGRQEENPPPVGIGLEGAPVVGGGEGRLTLSCRLRRG